MKPSAFKEQCTSPVDEDDEVPDEDSHTESLNRTTARKTVGMKPTENDFEMQLQQELDVVNASLMKIRGLVAARDGGVNNSDSI